MSEPLQECLQPPDLSWNECQARHQACEDAYFSVEGGLAESRYVFLEGNDLAERFAHCQRFVIGELGFGTGLNVLQTWRLWRQHAPASAHLDLFSVEAEPMTPQQMQRALRAWPELEPDLQQLCDALPPSRRGFHSIELAGHVRLHLLYGDVSEVLAHWSEPVDAWYLDGFAPSRNSRMWSDGVLQRVAELTRAGGSFATYTAAGFVRRSLQRAGFEVSKRKGFGRKRDMLVGRRTAPGTTPKAWLSWPKLEPDFAVEKPRNIAVIGHGLAGCCTARELAERGHQVSLFGVGTSYSANIPAMLVRAYPERDRSLRHRLYARAFEEACRFYSRYAPAAWQLQPEHQTTGQPATGIIRPPVLLQALLNHPNIQRQVAQVRSFAAHNAGWRLDSEANPSLRDFDLLILCSARLPAALSPLAAIEPCAGQVLELEQGPNQALSDEIHAIPLDASTLLGSSYRPNEAATDLRETETNALVQKAAQLGWIAPTTRPIKAHASLRQTTKDHLPLVGPAPDLIPWQSRQIQHMRVRRVLDKPAAPYLDRLWLNLAHGSRAATMAPLAASLIARALEAECSGLEADLLAAIHPGRFVTRRIKRGETLPPCDRASSLHF